MDHQVTVLTSHDIHGILSQVQPKHISMARQLRLKCALLMPPNVTLKRCTVVNPVTLLPLDSKGGEGERKDLFSSLEERECLLEEYDCVALMTPEAVGFEHVKDVPIVNPDFELFVDASQYQADNGRFYTGYAVVTQHDVVIAKPLPPNLSAQEAELKALTETCKVTEGKTVNIYTDSRHAFGIADDWGPIWRAKASLTSSGKSIKNADSVRHLMDALQLPTGLGVIKVKAHIKANTPKAWGNARAD
ncbi:hypothetical protein PRIEUP_LOCUS1122, partial [Pristimantis euphronides]